MVFIFIFALALTSSRTVLEGANPSAEGEDADDGGEGDSQRVLDIEDQFRLNKIESKPSKKAFQGEIKSEWTLQHVTESMLIDAPEYVKKVLEKLKESGASEEKIKEFQGCAAGAVKKILGNYDNYDMYMGESMEEDSMYILVDFREDGKLIWRTFVLICSLSSRCHTLCYSLETRSRRIQGVVDI